MSASMELEVRGVREVEDERSNKHSEKTKNKAKRRKKKRSSYIPKLCCFVSETEQNGGLEMEAICIGDHRPPTHLIVMVNGIIGSASNWRYGAKQFMKRYPQDVIVHCSECNYSMLTFEGVDVMGERLATEVISVIKRRPDLQKISFVSHSLGGLVSRYAIARLYERDPMRELSQENAECRGKGSPDACLEEKLKGKIAGLEPINFITFATPHLGSRAHKQVPMFCGFYTLEKVASHASWILGRTGRHLLLTDGDDGNRPLLLQMVHDSEDLQFISALQSFRRRVAYANARCDYLVGWCTSSIRRPNELPDRRDFARNDKYPHIVNVESAKTASPQQAPLEAKSNGHHSTDVEEEMIRSLTKLSWERIDVSFSGIKQRFLAHSTIQVKNYRIYREGADVIQHMVDHFLL